MAKFGKALGVYIVGSIIVNAIYYGVSNLMDGKDILGRKKKAKPRDETFVDWKGNIHAGTADYQVV